MADRFLECVRSNPLFATFAASSLMFVFLIFGIKCFVCLLAEKRLHFHRFLIKILSSNSIQNSIIITVNICDRKKRNAIANFVTQPLRRCRQAAVMQISWIDCGLTCGSQFRRFANLAEPEAAVLSQTLRRPTTDFKCLSRATS